MHELAVTQGILDTVLETARQHGGPKIIAIDLVVGDLSSIVDDSVQFYFDILSQNTLAQSAALRFRREPAVTVCQECGHRFETSAPLLPQCPACGSVRLHITGGREFYVESIEIDDHDSGS